MEPETAAYFAGLFDGEGYITVYPGRPDHSAVLYAGMGSTDLSVLDLLKRTFGGCLTRPRISSRASRRISREWKITNEGAADFLRAIYPYLRIKKRQAALAFKFRKMMSQNFRSRDEHRMKLFLELAQEIRSLNRGQVPVVETVKGTPLPAVKSQSSLPE
ncbi:MAG TPA: hypothetical protein VNJ12_04565 [Candidatus Dormibacteraeota bacterium]|nr:hypothetical protein [Candidatus Dormibacteraeota bacterium]